MPALEIARRPGELVRVTGRGRRAEACAGTAGDWVGAPGGGGGAEAGAGPPPAEAASIEERRLVERPRKGVRQIPDDVVRRNPIQRKRDLPGSRPQARRDIQHLRVLRIEA